MEKEKNERGKKKREKEEGQKVEKELVSIFWSEKNNEVNI